MGKYVSYTPPAKPSAEDLAKAVMDALRRAVDEHGAEMSERYLRKLQNANYDRGVRRLTEWYRVFWGTNVRGKYIEAMKEARYRYLLVRPK